MSDMLNDWSNNLYLGDLTIQIKLLEQVVKEIIHKRKPVTSSSGDAWYPQRSIYINS